MFTGEGYTKVTADVHGVISYVPVPFTPPNVDGCQHSGLTCPLTKGKNYVYNNAIPIKSSYPNVSYFSNTCIPIKDFTMFLLLYRKN